MAVLLPSVLPARRFLILTFIVVVIGIHYLFSVIHKDYDRLPSLTHLSGQLGLSKFYENSELLNSTFSSTTPPVPANITAVPEVLSNRANATFVFLCRNQDLAGVVTSIKQMEDRFNRNYQYPWVLLNEEPFTEEFKRRVRILTDAPIFFGQVPSEHWYQPEWIDENQAQAGRLRMMAQGIIYAGSVPYRNMCRFNSGFFFQHELLKPFRYYWRVEPEVKFFCDVTYDPFRFMEDNSKVYGFTISLVEWEATIPTLWASVKEFIVNNSELISPDNAMGFLSDNGGDSYNLCHYWSNFEIADMDFWRGEAYQRFFDFLEAKGGFYYERWGDAPVHSIAASLFARKDQLHFFRDIGYRHDPFQHCPSGEEWIKGRCSCDPNDSFDYVVNSCIKKYESLF
ncbi:glycosyltransferase family 15 protein [Crassisporium funariophilum]|nr:glycosyltransferase family 15 protein [Crassisporium funariophilum]